MNDVSSNNKRIAKNTIFLYARMVVIMFVSFYTSRVVLQALGVVDYGIYTVVGGLVTTFNVVVGSLADSTQRFITFELGKKDEGNVGRIFSMCVILHLLLALVAFIIMEPIGLWFLENKIQMPTERLGAAHWVLQFSLLLMAIMIMLIPFNALVIAHERMSFFSWVSILDALLRLFVAFSISYYGGDKLIIYSLLLAIAQLILFTVYLLFCKYSFKIKPVFVFDRLLIKKMGTFASWTIFGNGAFICYNQGTNLLLGVFFSPVVNAARGISIQVQGGVNTFVKNFQSALSPQITKSYADNNIPRLHSLLTNGSRISFYLLMIPLIPLLLETEFVLNVWLTVVPDYTVPFVRLLLVSCIFTSFSNIMEVSIKATGNISRFELFAYGPRYLVIPISYLLLKSGLSPIVVYIVVVASDFAFMLFCLYFAKKQVRYNVKEVVCAIYPKNFIVCIISFVPGILMRVFLSPSAARFCVICLASIIWSGLVVYLGGLTNKERGFVNKKIMRKL